MSDPQTNESRPVARVKHPLRCGKCGAFHDREARDCEKCGAHLWSTCGRCRAENPRTYSRCSKCGRRLSRFTTEWIDWLLYSQSPAKRTLMIILAALIGLLVVAAFLHTLASGGGPAKPMP